LSCNKDLGRRDHPADKAGQTSQEFHPVITPATQSLRRRGTGAAVGIF